VKILLASNNKHKAEEVTNILENAIPGKIELLLPKYLFVDPPEIEETGNTLEENSFIKSKAFFDLAGIPTIADDTGLEVDYLNGAPGVFSARFSGVHGNDFENRKKLLNLLSGLKLNQRKARFRTVICYFDGTNPVFIEGRCEGVIADHEIGTEGFGYDSIFIPKDYSKTFAEMSSSEKNEISHRSKAIKTFAEFLSKI
jgi:XTP/dITP diphosphohydrolase